MTMSWCVRAAAAVVLFGSVAPAGRGLADDAPGSGRALAHPLKVRVDRAALTARLESEIPRLMKAGDVPGLSIAVVRDAGVLWDRGFGVRNAETGEAVSDDTVFEAASLSKPVFAYLVLKLVESGALDLDAPLSRYLPEPYVEGDERLELITARRVLTHTTGFPNWRPDGKPLTIHFRPGERFSYSGEGFVYLQRVVERVTGKPLEVLAKETVFGPLGMQSSSFVWEDRYQLRKATGHDGAGTPRGVRRPDRSNAAASLHTTAPDYAKFMVATMNGTGLKRATLQEMLKPHARVDEGCQNCTNGGATGRLSPSIFWGLGWGLQRTRDGLAFWHWGDNNGDTHCFAIGYPRQKMGVVVFTNSGNGHSIIPEIVAEAVGGANPVAGWLDYEPYDSPAKRLHAEILARGVAAVDDYKRSRRPGAAAALAERQTNRVGYWLLGKRRFAEAVAVFEMNVQDHPQSWNAYDSLGEALMAQGDTAAAIRSYEKSVKLNPGNVNGTRMLERLRSQ
jgi:CubicO group peptidase (beta-lactamase class C family)